VSVVDVNISLHSRLIYDVDHKLDRLFVAKTAWNYDNRYSKDGSSESRNKYCLIG